MWVGPKAATAKGPPQKTTQTNKQSKQQENETPIEIDRIESNPHSMGAANKKCETVFKFRCGSSSKARLSLLLPNPESIQKWAAGALIFHFGIIFELVFDFFF